jgi:hypothetical protein
LTQPAASSAASAAATFDPMTLPSTDEPVQAAGATTASWVAGPPRSEVITFCSWARSSACVRACRTAGSEVAWALLWLYHCSPTIAWASSWSSLAASRRAASGPWIAAALSAPERSWLAAVVSLGTTLTWMVAGMPVVAVVAPAGPQV